MGKPMGSNPRARTPPHGHREAFRGPPTKVLPRAVADDTRSPTASFLLPMLLHVTVTVPGIWEGKNAHPLKGPQRTVRDENADAIYADAAAGTDVVILPLPWNAMDQTLGQL